jgi:hypothetical protein
MARCEDFPCCGHERGCCPNYDGAGNQLDMVCVCGARLPVTSQFSVCETCLMRSMDYDEAGVDDYDCWCEDYE